MIKINWFVNHSEEYINKTLNEHEITTWRDDRQLPTQGFMMSFLNQILEITNSYNTIINSAMAGTMRG